jgi:hypothetical protein
VPPLALDAMRIAGEKNILPDDVTRKTIRESGRDKVIGSYKLCVKRTGAVASVTLLKTTGFPSYDQRIMSTIRAQWRYRPFLINNKPARVCTAVTFIYTQRAAPPAPKAPQP